MTPRATPRTRCSTNRLSLESLGAREAPSTLIGGGFAEPNLAPFATEERVAIAANQAPTITDFKAVVGPDGQVTLSGRVSDDQAVEGLVVHISGRGVDVTAIVLRDGSFQVTTTVTSKGDVTVSATVTDAEGLTSNPAYTTFAPTN